MASWIFFSSEIASSSENEFSLLLSVGKTSLMRESEMRHRQTDIPPKTGVLFARSGHQQKGDITLVVRVPSTVVEVLSVDDDQVEAVEEKVVVQVPFLEAKEHLQWRTLQLPKT